MDSDYRKSACNSVVLKIDLKNEKSLLSQNKPFIEQEIIYRTFNNTVKLGDKEQFDKEQIVVKKPFPVTSLPVYFIRIRNIWR